MLYADYDDPFDDTVDKDEVKHEIVRTGRLFGGLIKDVK